MVKWMCSVLNHTSQNSARASNCSKGSRDLNETQPFPIYPTLTIAYVHPNKTDKNAKPFGGGSAEWSDVIPDEGMPIKGHCCWWSYHN